MKLIRCYIENFGGLHHYTADFKGGLTVIHEPNGFGKTTLAEFIRAMFYGFPRAGRDLSKNPRLKYLPWQGGRCGGYLIFEHEGKRYRIERSFGETPKGDKCRVCDEDTQKEIKDFGTDIGLSLFGLDSDSFVRSTYMPQLHDNSPLSTDNIRAKLGRLLEDTGDVGSYEKALQRLRDKRSLYAHYRGSGGTIHEAQTKITALQQELALCQESRPRLENVTAELAKARTARESGEAALQRIRTRLSAATTAQGEAALSREYERLCRDKREAAQALDTLKARYPKGIPTAEELEAAAEGMDTYAALEAQFPRFSTEDEAQWEALSLCFAAGVPHEDAIRRAEDAMGRAEALRAENLRRSAEPVCAPPQKKFHSLFFPALLIGILAAAAGIYLLTTPVFDSHMMIGAVCGVSALVLLIAAAMMQNNHSLLCKLQAGGMDKTAAQRREENERTATALEAEVNAFLAPYPIQAEGTARSRLAELTGKRLLYLHLLSRREALQSQTAELQAAITAAVNGHKVFCARYGLALPINDRRALKSIERDGEAFVRLTREAALADKALRAFVAEHGHRPVKSQDCADDDLDKLKAAEGALIEKLNALHAHILRLEQQARLLRADLDRIPALTDELRRQTERKAEDAERVRLLDTTADLLRQARESLSATYLDGVKQHFARYLNVLTGEQGGHIAVSSDLEVQLERMGSARPLSYFSAGQSDAVQLCMRLALSDALFEGEPCFMILDDPFVNLDDRHTAQALALLEALSEERQIIYLTCNSSRV